LGWRWRFITTFAISQRIDLALAAFAIGGFIGVMVSRRVQMTQMPELVAAMHSLVGLAAVLIAYAVVNDPGAFNVEFPIPRGNRLELFVGTLSAQSPFGLESSPFGKLAGLAEVQPPVSRARRVFMGQHVFNLVRSRS
jgi:NAD(P) transhydrogenase subunit beta